MNQKSEVSSVIKAETMGLDFAQRVARERVARTLALEIFRHIEGSLPPP